MEIFDLMTIILMMWLSYSFYTIWNEFKKSCDEINEKVDKLQKELYEYLNSLNK